MSNYFYETKIIKNLEHSIKNPEELIERFKIELAGLEDSWFENGIFRFEVGNGGSEYTCRESGFILSREKIKLYTSKVIKGHDNRDLKLSLYRTCRFLTIESFDCNVESRLICEATIVDETDMSLRNLYDVYNIYS